MNKPKKTKDFKRKYSRALVNTPELEQGELCMQMRDGSLKKIDAKDVKHNGVTHETLFHMFQEEKERLAEHRNALKGVSQALSSLFASNGYNYIGESENDITENISKLQIVHNLNTTNCIVLNEDGTVKDIVGVDAVLPEHVSVPEDFNKGYWRFIDGMFVLDKELYNQYWGAL
jgi:hypothetical protein